MEKNTNLDELYPGLEAIYTEAYEKYGKKFDEQGKGFKLRYQYLILIIITVILINLCDKFLEAEISGDFTMLIIYISVLIGICLALQLLKTPIPSAIVNEFENTLLKRMIPNIVKNTSCNDERYMEKEYQESDAYKQGYDIYTCGDYYTYTLADGRKVENIYLHVIDRTIGKDGETEYDSIFVGQFIKLKNKYKFKERIDILKDKNENGICGFLKGENDSKESDLKLDNSAFEKDFKILCNDKHYAYQILTADVMELLIESNKKLEVGFEVILIDDNIYIKIEEHLLKLYSNSLNNPFKRSTVEYFVKKIKASMDFLEEFTKKLDEKNM